MSCNDHCTHPLILCILCIFLIIFCQDITNEESIQKASTARHTKLKCDSSKGNCSASFGDSRHSHHAAVGGSLQSLQLYDSSRGDDACQRNAIDEATSKDDSAMVSTSIIGDSKLSSTGQSPTDHLIQNSATKCRDGVVMTSPLIPCRNGVGRNNHLVDHVSGEPKADGKVLPNFSRTCVLPTSSQPNDNCCFRSQIALAAILPAHKHGACVDKFLGRTTTIVEACDGDSFYRATEYIEEMIDHFRKVESVTSVGSIYMEQQQVINERMRSILVDWLIDIHASFRLVPETLHLTVNLVDRYLERRHVARTKLQLVGVSCFLIASKYEECMPLTLSDLAYICDNAYQSSEVRRLNCTWYIRDQIRCLTNQWDSFVLLFPPDCEYGARYIGGIGLSRCCS